MLTVVTGPPCSGKSTYVQERARPGDIVIDFDLLAEALGSVSTHDHPEHIRHVAVATRKAAIQAALREHRCGHHVWIVQCDPLAWPDATVVHLTADPAELHRRADAAGRPARTHAAIDHYVNAVAPLTKRW